MLSNQPLRVLFKHGWFVSHLLSMRHCAPPSPSSLLFLFWLKIVLDYFNTFSLYPVGSQFQVERITLVNTFPFGTKLQSHSQVKGGFDKKIVSSTQPHLSTPFILPFPLDTLFFLDGFFSHIMFSCSFSTMVRRKKTPLCS